MARACRKRNDSDIFQNADALIGLGSGLTPSGDDFVGGMLFAIKILQAVYSNLEFMNDIISIEGYRSKTHIISFTLLHDLANGHAIEPLHQLINGFVSGKPHESMYPFVSQLTQLGNSTGWDMLAGLLTGLLVIYHNSSFTPSLQLQQRMEA
jgi:hypothetical protein